MATKLALALAAASLLSAPVFGQDAPSLADIARKARAEKKSGAPSSATASTTSEAKEPGPSPAVSAASSSASASPSGTTAFSRDLNPKLDSDIEGIPKFQAAIRELVDQEKFESIDQLATEMRSTRARFAGGFWKLHLLQAALGEPADGPEADEAEWSRHFRRLNKWIVQRPNSISARTALAVSYVVYAGKARGGGYADSVTEEGWKLFSERAAKARSVLEEAAAHQLKDPEWFLDMMVVARAEQWDMEEQTALFEKAACFEPDYYYYYRFQAESLLPKWEGEPGEMARWAEAQATRIGGKKGDVIYYEIATYLNCACDSDRNLNGMSWDRIRRGYAAVEQQYGPALLALNQYAYMAVMANDAASAQKTFERIGDNWSQETWHNRKFFDDCRAWAKNTRAAAGNAADNVPAR